MRWWQKEQNIPHSTATVSPWQRTVTAASDRDSFLTVKVHQRTVQSNKLLERGCWKNLGFFLTHHLPSLASRDPSSDTIVALILSGQEGRVECVSHNPVRLHILVDQISRSFTSLLSFNLLKDFFLNLFILFYLWSLVDLEGRKKQPMEGFKSLI